MNPCVLSVRESSGINDDPMTFYATVRFGVLRVGSTIWVRDIKVGTITGMWLRGHLIFTATAGYEVLVNVRTPYLFDSFCMHELRAV
jgi:hypothetical protein